MLRRDNDWVPSHHMTGHMRGGKAATTLGSSVPLTFGHSAGWVTQWWTVSVGEFCRYSWLKKKK